eukprot:scaffold169184_cov20-Tisochrysis_lutea.AAC.1
MLLATEGQKDVSTRHASNEGQQGRGGDGGDGIVDVGVDAGARMSGPGPGGAHEAAAGLQLVVCWRGTLLGEEFPACMNALLSAGRPHCFGKGCVHAKCSI